MRRLGLLVIIAAASLGCAQAQWEMQTSNTRANLRGIHSVGNGVAWASGSNGTVLRTEDSGFVWQGCAVPPGAEHLDFRGIQGFDAHTAIVMSSGTGDLSRLYKTADGCHTWKLVFANPDAEGFWDAIQFDGKEDGVLLGDPTEGQFTVFITRDGGKNWTRQITPGLEADPTRNGVFAASNSSLVMFSSLAHRFFVTGGAEGALFIECHANLEAGGEYDKVECLRSAKRIPVGDATEASGAFSLGFLRGNFVVVGGDYQKRDTSARTAAYSSDGGKSWHAAQTPPHGYRSSVAYDASTKTWITVGPNGTDVSIDDGKNWRAVRPDAALHEAPDADRNWNAISLPFVVGPKGRIAKLNGAALKQ